MMVILQRVMMTMLFGSTIAISEDGSVLLHIPDAFQPTKGSVIGHINVGDKLHIEMDVEVHSLSTGDQYLSLLHVTATDNDCCAAGDRFPAIWMHSQRDGFVAKFSTDDGNDGGFTKVALVPGKVYHWEIDVTQSRMTSIQDGVVYRDQDIGNHPHFEDAIVYASNPWYEAADVTISNLIISSFVSPALNAIEISSLEEEVADLEGTVSTVSGSVTALQGTVTGLEGSLSTLQDDVDDLKETMEAMMNAIKSNMGFSAVAVNGNYEGLEAAKAGGSAATMVLTAKDLAIIGLAAVNLMIMVFFAVNCKRSSAKVRYGVVSMGSETDIDQ